MKKTLNPHSLLEQRREDVLVQERINEAYTFWKAMFDKAMDKEADTFDAFVAGWYIGGNVSLKEKYNKAIKYSEKGLDT